MSQKRLLFRHNKCSKYFKGFCTFLDSEALNQCLIDKSRWSWQIVLRAGKISSVQQSWVSIYKSNFQEWSLKLSKSFKSERKVKVEFKHVISNNARGVQNSTSSKGFIQIITILKALGRIKESLHLIHIPILFGL